MAVDPSLPSAIQKILTEALCLVAAGGAGHSAGTAFPPSQLEKRPVDGHGSKWNLHAQRT